MKTALVTGGNRGIGKAITAGLVAQGHKVFIGARDLAAGDETAKEIGAQAIALDLQNPAAFANALAPLNGVDILVNNAGVLIDQPLDAPGDGFATSMQVMLHAPYELIRLCLPHMRNQGWGRIVNLSSDWGSFAHGLAGPGAYGVAKAGLNALTKAFVRDLPEGVKINAMCPGWVQTRMGGAGAERTPEEGADTALWLATLPDDGPTGGFFRDRQSFDW